MGVAFWHGGAPVHSEGRCGPWCQAVPVLLELAWRLNNTLKASLGHGVEKNGQRMHLSWSHDAVSRQWMALLLVRWRVRLGCLEIGDSI